MMLTFRVLLRDNMVNNDVIGDGGGLIDTSAQGVTFGGGVTFGSGYATQIVMDYNWLIYGEPE